MCMLMHHLPFPKFFFFKIKKILITYIYISVHPPPKKKPKYRTTYVSCHLLLKGRIGQVFNNLVQLFSRSKGGEEKNTTFHEFKKARGSQLNTHVNHWCSLPETPPQHPNLLDTILLMDQRTHAVHLKTLLQPHFQPIFGSSGPGSNEIHLWQARLSQKLNSSCCDTAFFNILVINVELSWAGQMLSFWHHWNQGEFHCCLVKPWETANSSSQGNTLLLVISMVFAGYSKTQ